MEAFEIPDRLPEKALGSLKKKLNRSILRDKGVPVTPLAFKKLRPDSVTSESESESSLKVDDIKTQVYKTMFQRRKYRKIKQYSTQNLIFAAH